jgi:upstream activation factor subunit UAF30
MMAAKAKTTSRKPVKKTVTAKKVVKKTTAAKKPAKKAASPKKVVKKKRAPNPAFMKAMKPSDALAKIVGNKPIPRTEITKKLWEYIKKNKLQDAANRRNINADANLLAVFRGKKQVSMFEMTKLVNKHLS